jgi:hypothetical protein
MLTYSVDNSTEFNNNSMTSPISPDPQFQLPPESPPSQLVNSLLPKPRDRPPTICIMEALMPCQSAMLFQPRTTLLPLLSLEIRTLIHCQLLVLPIPLTKLQFQQEQLKEKVVLLMLKEKLKPLGNLPRAMSLPRIWKSPVPPLLPHWIH